MVDVTPAGITPGAASDGSVVHASDAALGNLSRSHDERAIARLQSALLAYDATKTYDIGDIVFEGGFNWRNIVAIAVPEAFDDAKWRFIDNGLGIIIVSYDLDPPTDGEFFVVSGGDTSGDVSETDAQAPAAGNVTIFQMTLQVATNTLGTTTSWVMRKNGADGNGLITVGAGLTGTFQDLTNSDDMVTGDLMAYEYREGGGAGGLTLVGSGAGTSRHPA